MFFQSGNYVSKFNLRQLIPSPQNSLEMHITYQVWDKYSLTNNKEKKYKDGHSSYNAARHNKWIAPVKKIEYSEITILIAVEMDNDGVCYSKMTISISTEHQNKRIRDHSKM